MIGNVIQKGNSGGGMDGLSFERYVDITTNTCTEDQFLNILDDKLYTKFFVGVTITSLANSIYSGSWIIADVNHDSDNTGQTNCYDLISLSCVGNGTMNTYVYHNSPIHSYLNGSFYNAFSSSIKDRMINMRYQSYSSSWQNAYAVVPSATELGLEYPSYAVSGSIMGAWYPIFDSNDSRRFNAGGSYVWTRSNFVDSDDYSDKYIMVYYGARNISSINRYTVYPAIIRIS